LKKRLSRAVAASRLLKGMEKRVLQVDKQNAPSVPRRDKFEWAPKSAIPRLFPA
jgi:hypothetical protein